MAKESKNQSVLVEESCIRMDGTAAFAGLLSVTKSAIIFEPLNNRVRAMKRSSWQEDIGNITSVQFLGTKASVLIWTEGCAQRFVGPGARKIANYLLQNLSLLQNNTEAEPEQKPAPKSNVREISASATHQTFNLWSRLLGRRTKEQTIFGCKGSCDFGNGEEPAILLLTDYRVVLVPEEGPKRGRTPMHVRVLGIRPTEPKAANQSPINFTLGHTPVSFTPARGDEAAKDFWQAQSSIAVTRLPIGFHDNAPNRFLGASPRVSLRFEQGQFARDQPALVIALRDGIGIILPTPPTPPPKNGCGVQVDVYNDHGVHWFDTRVSRTGIAPRGVEIEGREAWHMMVVENPKRTHLMERRDLTRIGLDRHPVQVSLIEGGDDDEPNDGLHTGVVLNLSDSGCLVALSTKLSVGARYELYWRTAAGAVELSGTCIRVAEESKDEETPWHCALSLSQPEDKMSVTGVFRAI